MPKLVWISVHDFLSAKICVAAGVDNLMVGDSLGMSVYGFDSTHQVTMRMMLDHAAAVRRAAPAMDIVVDMPIGTYDTVETALQNAVRFREIGIVHLKLEGGKKILDQVKILLKNGFRVTGHLGMLPQSITAFKVSATTEEEQKTLLKDAKVLEQTGITNLVLECVPAAFASQIADTLNIPVIGIGAGSGVDGQVLVYADLIGRASADFSPKFLRRFGYAAESEAAAIADFCVAVRKGEYPDESESYL